MYYSVIIILIQSSVDLLKKALYNSVYKSQFCIWNKMLWEVNVILMSFMKCRNISEGQKK